MGPAINPIKIFGYQFDGPDIYFMDMIDREYFKYRNYMKNRTKYVYRNNQEIDWDKIQGKYLGFFMTKENHGLIT